MNFIPLDKSHSIRCICFDILNGIRTDPQKFNGVDLSDDIIRAVNASIEWKSNEFLDVGESATLFRFLKFISWKLNLKKKFHITGTLLDRKICDDPSIIDWSLEKLLTLDSNTSQWASVSYLCGNRNPLPKNIPFKLQLTMDVCSELDKDKNWSVKLDSTILNQARYFTKLDTAWKPEQSEDYCFARAFGFMSAQDGLTLWPSLVNHETNRIAEMERCLNQISSGVIDSKDHRVVQSLVMYCVANKINYVVIHPEAVNKTWPQFWDFLKYIKNRPALNDTNFEN
jgi:hypothetical protein